jgi:MinD-like ATPase involved in chromosome partitioning or flagellar assembly
VSDRPTVLIISQDPLITGLAAALKAERVLTETAETIADAEWFLRDHPDAIGVIDGALPLEVAFQAYELVHASESRSAVILVTPETAELFDPDGNGVAHDECVPKSAGVEQIILRLKAVMILAGFDVAIGPGAERRGPHPPPSGSQRGQITVIFSAKGGVGKTTLAVNAGVALARMGHATLLVDANLYFGDASILLNVVSKRSLIDLADVYQVDTASVQQLTVTHESGLAVLSSPAEVERVETLSTEIVVSAIRASAGAFQHVLVDTHSSFDETNLQILEMADRILLITTPEVGATYNTARFLSLADTLGYRDKVLLVLNRSETGIKTDAVESNLGTRVAATVVSAGRRAVSAANRGVPLILDDTRNDQRITRDLSHIAELIAGDLPRPAHAGEPKNKKSKKWPFGRKLALSSARSA